MRDGPDQIPDHVLEGTFGEPPAEIELEMALLGGMLTNRRLYDAVVDLVAPEDFIEAAHQRIFAKIGELSRLDRPTDAAAVKAHFAGAELTALAEVGGARYISNLAKEATWNAVDGPAYARMIREAARRRALIAWAQDVQADARTPDAGRTAADVAETAFARLDALTGGRDGEAIEAIAIGEAAQRALDQAEDARQTGRHIVGVATGYAALDEMIGGLGAGELFILAGRPGMGKSALAWGIARRVARAGLGVVFFSQEMSTLQVGRRALSEESSVRLSAIKRGRYGAPEIQPLIRGVSALRDLPVYVIDRPNLSPAQIRLETRRLQRRVKGGIGLVIVDHMQIMSAGEKVRDRVAELTLISKGLKANAKALDCPVIALSQLSRAVEQREPPTPMLSDLRESGSIEQDADGVLFLYRAHYYLSRQKPEARSGEDPAKFSERLLQWTGKVEACEHVADVIGAKLRDGEIGTVQLYWDGTRTMFADLDLHHDAGEAPFL